MEKEYSWLYQFVEITKIYVKYRIIDRSIFKDDKGLLIVRKKVTEGELSKRFMLFRGFYLKFIDGKIEEVRTGIKRKSWIDSIKTGFIIMSDILGYLIYEVENLVHKIQDLINGIKNKYVRFVFNFIILAICVCFDIFWLMLVFGIIKKMLGL